MPTKAVSASDCPESWIRNIEIVDLWAKGMSYDLHGVNYFQMPDGRLVCSLPNNRRITIPAPDALGYVCIGGETIGYQVALDRAYKMLQENYSRDSMIWSLDAAKGWGKKPATDSQLRIIQKKFKNFSTEGLNRLQASQILNRMFGSRGVSI